MSFFENAAYSFLSLSFKLIHMQYTTPVSYFSISVVVQVENPLSKIPGTESVTVLDSLVLVIFLFPSLKWNRLKMEPKSKLDIDFTFHNIAYAYIYYTEFSFSSG